MGLGISSKNSEESSLQMDCSGVEERGGGNWKRELGGGEVSDDDVRRCVLAVKTSANSL